MRPSEISKLCDATGSDSLRFQCHNYLLAINVIVGSDCYYKGVKAVIMPLHINK